MPRLFGLEMTRFTLMTRILIGSALAALSFIFLIYIPLNVMEIVSMIMQRLPSSAMLPPSMYLIIALLGAVIACLTFVVVVARGSKIYGPVLMAYGLVFVAYIVAFFQGGSMSLYLSLGSVAGFNDFSARMALSMFGIMVLYALPFALVAVKGIVVTRHAFMTAGRASGTDRVHDPGVT